MLQAPLVEPLPRGDEITADVRREIEEDSAWAESSPMPDPEKAAYNVFDNSIVPPAFRPKVLEN